MFILWFSGLKGVSKSRFKYLLTFCNTNYSDRERMTERERKREREREKGRDRRGERDRQTHTEFSIQTI